MRLQIPKQQHSALATFIKYPDKSIEALFAALERERPSLRIGSLASRVASVAELDASEVESILRALAGLYLVLVEKGVSPATLAQDLVETLNATDEAQLRIEPDEIEPFKERVIRALSFEKSLGITAKVFDVMIQHQRSFCKARILTDVRPVFYTDPRKPPAAAVLVHTLQIRYHEGSADHKEFFVALDNEDLGKLDAVLARAKDKAGSVRSLLKEKEIPFLEGE